MPASAIGTDSVQCTSTSQAHLPFTQSNGLNVPPHFQIPPINHPPPYAPVHQNFQPNPGIWPAQGFPQKDSNIRPTNFNPVTGQFLPMQNTNYMP